MKIRFHKKFEKQYEKLPQKIQVKVKTCNHKFFDDPYHPILNNHALKGKYAGYRSINVTSDIRIIYKQINIGVALFCAIGSHSKLYR